MASRERSKEVWFIPKRSSLYQIICLIGAIIERKYDGLAWNPQKQNNLGVNLSRMGATKRGGNISNQSIRTLVALPQYLGFLYLNAERTPSRIKLTKAGMQLWEEQKSNINAKGSLSLNDKGLQSEITLLQLEKLIITNPIIRKDCEHILTFPFRFTLSVLLDLGYLDTEEIALYVLQSKHMDEVKYVCQQIRNFRKLSKIERQKLVRSFKSTAIGNLTLVQAPSVKYYMNICCMSGLVKIEKVTPKNLGKAINSISILSEKVKYVKSVNGKKYKGIVPFDFDTDVDLWIEYIGNPNRLYPPILVTIENKDDVGYIYVVSNDQRNLYGSYIEPKGVVKLPLFPKEKHSIKMTELRTGKLIKDVTFVPSKDKVKVKISAPIRRIQCGNVDYAARIKELLSVRNLPKDIVSRIKIVNQVLDVGISEENKYLRGAYLEYYFYRLLEELKNEGIIDDVVWNGKVNEYGFPVSAPGGVIGKSDIVFVIGHVQFVLEVTTIQSKSSQFKAEGASVPDHIRLLAQENVNKETVGIFVAPVIHLRNTSAMQAAISKYSIKLNCMKIEELIDVLKTKDRDKIMIALSKR